MNQDEIHSAVLSELADVAVGASIEGDGRSIEEVVEYLVGEDPTDMATVFSLALEKALLHPVVGAAQPS